MSSWSFELSSNEVLRLLYRRVFLCLLLLCKLVLLIEGRSVLYLRAILGSRNVSRCEGSDLLKHTSLSGPAARGQQGRYRSKFLSLVIARTRDARCHLSSASSYSAGAQPPSALHFAWLNMHPKHNPFLYKGWLGLFI